MEEELLSLVEQLKSDRRLASFDEAATKQIVLLRILSLLGWDIYNIDEVMPEYSVGSQRVDYALRHSNANKVFIEVKRVGEDLERHQEQLLNYSFKEGVSLAILTNGMSWRFYLPLHEGSWEQRKFYTVEIYDQKSEDIVSRFLDYLAKENVYSGKYIQNAEAVYKSRQREYLVRDTLPKAWDKLISEPDDLLIELIADATEKLCGYKPDNSVVEHFISSNIAGGQVPTEVRIAKEPIRKTTITKLGSYIGKSVTAFIFKNTRYEVRYWIEVLSQICKLTYNLHRSSFESVLQLRGSKRPYFTRNPNELRVPQQIEDSDIFMETNLSSVQIVRISVNVILLFGYSEKDLIIEAH
ncbi:MAG: restriction endonuclease subunit R [Dehalococcoidia bacterium]